MLQNMRRNAKFLVPLLGVALLALPAATAGPARAQAEGGQTSAQPQE